MRKLLSILNPLERISYATWMLTVIAMLAWWRWGTYAMALLTLVVAIRCIVNRHIGNPALERRQRICLWIMIVYWVLYIFSAFYSTDKSEAWGTVETKIPFVVLPLLCLGDDTRYLSREHIRGLFYLAVATLSVRFLAAVVVSLYAIVQGSSVGEAFFWEFDPFGLHHNYLSLFVVIALAFIYTDIRQQWSKRTWRWKSVIVTVAAMLFVYMMLSNSRSGIVATGVLVVVIVLHTTFVLRHWRTALLTVGCAIVALIVTSLALPKTLDRFTYAIHEIQEGRPADDRVIMAQCVFDAIEGHWLFGYGSGDYMPALLSTYATHDYLLGIEKHMGSHNQYLETLMETGIIGVVVLLVMLLAPLATVMRHDRHHLLTAMLTTAIMSSILFESMFNRQMGVQIATLCYCLMILDSNRRQITLKNTAPCNNR